MGSSFIDRLLEESTALLSRTSSLIDSKENADTTPKTACWSLGLMAPDGIDRSA
jgi:hypothetical protein